MALASSVKQLGRQDGRLGSAFEAELGEQAGDVILHRLLGDESRWPIWRLVSPSAISWRISFSRSVRLANSSGSAVPERSRWRTLAVTAGSSNDWPRATVRMAWTNSLLRTGGRG